MNKKHVYRAIGLIFLIVFVWRISVLLFKSSSDASNKQGRPPIAVEIDSVSYGPIQEKRQLTGSVYPLYQYIVAPKVSGRVIRLNKRIGDWVKRNELIAKIDDAEYEQSVLEAEANLKISEANLAEIKSQFELARQELERVQLLQQKGIASPSELDAASTNFSTLQSRIKLATAQVEQRQAALTSAKIRLNYTLLRATEPGFVGERYVDEGTLLAPNSPLVSIIGIDTVIIRTTVIERIYGRIRTSQPAEIEVDAYPGKCFDGQVSRISPMLQEASRVAQMEVEVANDSLLLKPGMFSKVTIVLAEKDTAQIVPAQAIVNRNGTSGVFVVNRGETVAHYVPIEMGINSSTTTEILSPKITGLVITLGQHLLEEGSVVILPGQRKMKEKSASDSH